MNIRMRQDNQKNRGIKIGRMPSLCEDASRLAASELNTFPAAGLEPSLVQLAGWLKIDKNVLIGCKLSGTLYCIVDYTAKRFANCWRDTILKW